MALILLNNITFYENRNTEQNGELSIWVMLQRNLRERTSWFSVFVLSLIICLWCAISYLPFIWHPQVQITSSGSVPYLQVGSRVDKSVFYLEAQNAVNRNSAPPQGILVNLFIYPLPMKSLRLWSPRLPHHLNNLIRRGFIKVYGTVLNWYFQLFYFFIDWDSTGYFVWFF